MKVKLVSIGNSKGVRIPRSVIDECGFGDQVEMRVDNGVIVLKPTGGIREGWDSAFSRMAEAGDDMEILPEGMSRSWDEEDWEW